MIAELPAKNVFALIDRAFDKSVSPELKARFPYVVQQALVKDYYVGPGLESLSPCLIRVPETPEERLDLLAHLLRTTNGKPMLSFIAAKDVSVLSHLRAQIEAIDDQGKRFLLRLADTRALDALLKILTAQQHQRLLVDGLDWWYWRRNGEFRHISCVAPVRSDAPQAEPYAFTAQQLQQMAQAARADSFLFSLRKNTHLFGTLMGRPSEAYQCVQALLASDDSTRVHDSILFRQMLEALNRNGLLAHSFAGNFSTALHDPHHEQGIKVT